MPRSAPSNSSHTPVHAVAVAGASGRMGQMLIEALAQSHDCRLAGALDLPSSPAIGSDAGAAFGQASGVVVTADLTRGLSHAHCLIDFTRPEGSMAHLRACRQLGLKAVVGTTGFSDAQKAEIAQLAQGMAIVMAPNMSVGVNVTLKLLEMAAKALSSGYDIEIIEAHHRHKIDAPSGTALKMGEVIAQALGRDLKDCGVYAREGVTGERDPSTIGFASIRGGDIVGDHTVLFAGTGERIEITHKSASRATYAQGSLRAARFLAGHSTGVFDMFDVLGLREGEVAVNILTFWAQGDFVIRAMTVALLALSVSTWVVILWKTRLLQRVGQDVSQSIAAFWQAAHFEEANTRVAQFDRDGCVLPLLGATLIPVDGTMAAAGNRTQQLTRVLRESLQNSVHKLQWGQLLLATAGSISPFVGLLGTVWGIFNALSGMAEAGQITLDRVAGPVGEALVMTAAGLAVAIPAVLAYNVFGRQVARIEAELEGFAHDLLALLTGQLD